MILATVWRQAEKRGYVTRNVAKMVGTPEVVQREATILTLEQVEVLLVALKGERFDCFFSAYQSCSVYARANCWVSDGRI